MEKMKNNFGKDFREALNKADEPVRKYNGTKSKKKEHPERARFKMKVFFKNGDTPFFYSFDKVWNAAEKKVYQDEWTGLMKLKRLLNKFEGKLESAVIYANVLPTPFTPCKVKDIKSFYEVPVYIINDMGYKWENDTLKFTHTGEVQFERLRYVNVPTKKLKLA